jgi:hypothetical protein
MVSSDSLYDRIKGEKGALKHLYKVTGVVDLINDDPMLSLNVAFYQDWLDKKQVKIALWQYAGDQKKLKELSQWAQKSGPRVKNWELLVGIENLYGWRPNNEDVSKEVHDWVTKVFKPNYDGSETAFNEKFRQAVRKVLRWKTGVLEQKIKLEEFCTDIASTGTPGSAFDPNGPKLEAGYEGIKVKPYNNKFSKSAVLSTENKMKRALAKEKQKCKVSVKVEFFPKKRLIVSSDYNTTLKMRFVDTWISEWMRGNPHSTLWMDKDQMLKMWIAFAKKTKWWNSPVDQTGFDHHASKAMVMIVLDEILKLITDHSVNGEELKEVMEGIIFALDGGDIIWTDGDGKTRSTEYLNGVLSGWQWTAFIDTVINIAEHFMALDMMRELGIQYEEGLFNAQGDDQLEQFSTARACVAYWACLTSMGFELHPHKNFFSKIHNEYLRKISYDNMVNGYAARMINSLLWLYPGTNQPKDKVERMRNIVTNWEKFGQRCSTRMDEVLKYISRDCRGAKIERGFLMDFLYTARTTGGYGLGLDTGVGIKTSGGEWKRITVKGRGYEQFKLRFGQDQDRELDNWIYNVTAMPKEVNDVELESKVESVFEQRGRLKPLQFSIVSDTPKLNFQRSDEPINTLFSLIPEVMRRYFPKFEEEASLLHAPRSWAAEYASGKVKSHAPRMEGLSDEMAGLVWSKYRESMAHAMYTKQTRHPEKWLSLNLYAEIHFSTILNELQLPIMLG